MKALIYCLLLIPIILSGCNKNDNPEMLPPCDSIVLNTYSKANGKIVELNIQDTGSIYVITVSKWDMLLYKNHPINEWDSILVPCPELPVEYREDNLRVLFSGEKTGCCDLLTLPATGRSFSCKLEIDSLYTFTLPPNLIDLLPDTYINCYDSNNCGPCFYPDSLQREYKIRFRYRTPEEFEEVQFSCGPCTYLCATFNWEEYDQVIIGEVTRVIN